MKYFRIDGIKPGVYAYIRSSTKKGAKKIYKKFKKEFPQFNGGKVVPLNRFWGWRNFTGFGNKCTLTLRDERVDHWLVGAY